MNTPLVGVGVILVRRVSGLVLVGQRQVKNVDPYTVSFISILKTSPFMRLMQNGIAWGGYFRAARRTPW